MQRLIAGKKVLVVDDQATIRMIVEAILTHDGAQVLQADCAMEAIRLAEKQSVDAFLLDIQLPEMSGIDLCRTLRTLNDYRNTPVIFVTSLDERDTLQSAVDSGGDDFIQKPIDPVILRARLGNLLQKTEYLRQIEMMNRSLHHYVSPRSEEMARIYARTGVLPAPKQHEMSVLFTDVRDFTGLSQQLQPDRLFQSLSEHLAAQAAIVYTHGGYVDKFSGDGMMAVFDGADMTLRSCLCALDILEVSKRRMETEGTRINQLGIGIHTGHAMIGNLGSSAHLDYTPVGETVNLAARLCGVAERLAIVVSQAVRDALAGDPRFTFSAERQVRMRGFDELITVYDLSRGNASA